MANRTKYIAPSKAAKAFTNYSSAIERLKEGSPIYRGIRHYSKMYATVKPSQVERTSKNTSNVYTALMDSLPSWKGYPKRSRSIICSSGLDYALGYAGPSSKFYASDTKGALYSVLPKNGSSIGICPNDDVWNSFPEISSRWQMDHMDEFNRHFSEIFYTFFKHANGWRSRQRNEIEEMNGEEIQQLLRDADLEIPNVEGATEKALAELEERGYEYESIVADIRHNKIEDELTWVEYFSKLMDPETNGFDLHYIENYNPAEVEGEFDFHEVWTDADCLLIRMSYYNQEGTRIGNDFRYLNDFVERMTGENPDIMRL